MAYLQFNASNVAPMDDFTPVPAGQYIAAIRESEIAFTKSGTGKMLKLIWIIMDGEFKGRLIFDRINIENQNPKATEIGQRQLASICHATNILNLQDTQQLHGFPCMLSVVIKTQEGYDPQNEVKHYAKFQQSSAPTNPPPVQQPLVTQPGATPPWAPPGGAGSTQSKTPW